MPLTVAPDTHVSKVQIKTLVAPGGAASVGCASGSSQPLEIVTLANSLKCDVDLIYEYVYDTIEYEPLFGSNKGALGTLLDQRGSDIDQAQLFVALLNTAGITQTSFVYGYITVTGPGPTLPSAPCAAAAIASAPGWLGVNNDAIAIENLIVNGGIPVDQTSLHYNTDGTLGCLDVMHVWVQVTLDGTNYVFDPSFKQHTTSSGLAGLGTVLGYSQSGFIADAAGTIDAISISNINRARVRADLTSYANNLIAYIKANNPGFQLSDIIGGKKIIPLSGSPIRQTSLPYLSAASHPGFPQNWNNTVPNQYRTCLSVTLPLEGTAQPCASATSETIVFYADETYGKRITVFSIPDLAHTGLYKLQLLIDGAPPATGVSVSGFSASIGFQAQAFAAISHPFGVSDITGALT